MGDDIKFRQQLLVIDENLGTEEVEALKFLCSDLLSFKKLEAVESAQDIFQLLMAKDLLNKEDTFILAELLYRIRCHFLLQKLGYTKETVQENLPWKGKVSRQMLYELSEDITSEDLKRAMFLLRDQLPKKLTNMLLTFLEKQDHLAQNNLQILEKICMDISPDLLKTVNKYKMERGENSEWAAVRASRAGSRHQLRKQTKWLWRFNYPHRSMLPVDKSGGSLGNQEMCVAAVSGVPGSCINRGLQFPWLSKLMTYRMDGPHRGYCLIINNFSFTGTLQKRRGSNKDAEMLAQVFTWLGLDVKTYTDKTSVEIKNLMQEWRSSKDHRDRDCFVCCILSHGESGLVYGIDEQEVPIRTIMSYFTARQCPQLAEKPKLFFIQACQGKEIQQAVYIEADAQNPDLLPIQQLVSPSESIPEEADFLLGMATVGGYASFRHIQHGTWYIQSLCNKLQLLVPSVAAHHRINVVKNRINVLSVAAHNRIYTTCFPNSNYLNSD
uniref:Caspase-8 n=1 Tax=Terrapene triunguis TaxID=2587831 RepID=A0A674J0Y3_9SAUR